jgi:hypothetical protein
MIRFGAVYRVFIERSLAPKLDNLIGGRAVVAVTGRTEPAQGSQTAPDKIDYDFSCPNIKRW